METKGVGQEGMEKCLGSGQGPNWAVEPLVVILVPWSGILWKFHMFHDGEVCVHISINLFDSYVQLIENVRIMHRHNDNAAVLYIYFVLYTKCRAVKTWHTLLIFQNRRRGGDSISLWAYQNLIWQESFVRLNELVILKWLQDAYMNNDCETIWNNLKLALGYLTLFLGWCNKQDTVRSRWNELRPVSDEVYDVRDLIRDINKRNAGPVFSWCTIGPL
jgi:hypothetical protein